MAKPFLEARVKGFRIPWHVNFPEINLRFYLKRRINGEDRRGVAFIAEIVPRAIQPGSLEDFITEHYYGYTKGRVTGEYRVEHPSRLVFALQSYRVDLDFGAVYGKEWGFLSTTAVHSALLAEGSEIKVHNADKV